MRRSRTAAEILENVTGEVFSSRISDLGRSLLQTAKVFPPRKARGSGLWNHLRVV